MINPTVSVVIRNRNEADSLKEVFRALQFQEFTDFEVVLVDNRSSDSSVQLAEKFGAKVVNIDDFTYGKALNLGMSHSSGEIIVILSAHSVPMGRHFLTECVAAFNDSRVAAARLVYLGKRADMDRWLAPEILDNTGQDFHSKGPLASGCAIRRSVWQSIPFDEDAIAAEDKIWAAAILSEGYTIVTPIPAFYFYRKRLSPLVELKKNYNELVALNSKFGLRVGFINQKRSEIVYRFFRSLAAVSVSSLKSIRYEAVKGYLSFKFPRNL